MPLAFAPLSITPLSEKNHSIYSCTETTRPVNNTVLLILSSACQPLTPVLTTLETPSIAVNACRHSTFTCFSLHHSGTVFILLGCSTFHIRHRFYIVQPPQLPKQRNNTPLLVVVESFDNPDMKHGWKFSIKQKTALKSGISPPSLVWRR